MYLTGTCIQSLESWTCFSDKYWQSAVWI